MPHRLGNRYGTANVYSYYVSFSVCNLLLILLHISYQYVFIFILIYFWLFIIYLIYILNSILDCPDSINVTTCLSASNPLLDSGDAIIICTITGILRDQMEYYWWLIDDSNTPIYTFSVRLQRTHSRQFDINNNFSLNRAYIYHGTMTYGHRGDSYQFTRISYTSRMQIRRISFVSTTSIYVLSFGMPLASLPVTTHYNLYGLCYNEYG